MRVATCIAGRVEIVVNCLPLFDYGTTVGEWSYDGDGYHSMSACTRMGDDAKLTVVSSMGLGLLGERCYGRTTLEEGQSGFVALSWRGSAPATTEEAFNDLAATVEYWRNWLGAGTFPDHPGVTTSSAAPSP